MASKFTFRLNLLILTFFLFNTMNIFSNDKTSTPPPKQTLINDINPTEAWKLQQSNKLLIIDVRTIQEWKETGVIPGSILVNMHDENFYERSNFIEEILNLIGDNKATPIGVICGSGARSSLTRDALNNIGYTNVLNISQGIMGKNKKGWIELNLPLKTYIE